MLLSTFSAAIASFLTATLTICAAIQRPEPFKFFGLTTLVSLSGFGQRLYPPLSPKSIVQPLLIKTAFATFFETRQFVCSHRVYPKIARAVNLKE